MASSLNNKKNQDGSEKLIQLTRRYSTRQIMALTEKRRKQLEEEARLEELNNPSIPSPLVQAAVPMEQSKQSAASVEKEFASRLPLPLEEEKVFPSRNKPDVHLTQKIEDRVSNNSDEWFSLADPFAFEPDPQAVIKQPAVTIPEDIKLESSVPSVPDGTILFQERENSADQVVGDLTKQEFIAEDTSVTAEEPVEPILEKADHESAVLDGKTVAAFFRQDPQNPTEQIVSDLIEQEFDKAIKQGADVEEFNGSGVRDFSIQDKVEPIEPDEILRNKPRVSAVVSIVLEVAFNILACVLFIMMLTHVLTAGWSQHYYDQAPFIFMMVLSLAWLNRRHFHKRREWFWGSTVILAGGLGVYLAAAVEGRIYIELAGFLIACFGLFLWRYTEESACRLFFPLTCLFFVFAPPELLERAAMFPLNDTILRSSALILNSLHVPALLEGMNIHVGGGVVYAMGDPTAFRSITAAMVLAAVCVSFQNMTKAWSAALFFSVIVWGLIGNIVRITVTGLILDGFGVEYASMFFTEYSVVVLMIIMVAGLTLTAGLLPHREEFE